MTWRCCRLGRGRLPGDLRGSRIETGVEVCDEFHYFAQIRLQQPIHGSLFQGRRLDSSNP
jgi:hypothetical protein